MLELRGRERADAGANRVAEPGYREAEQGPGDADDAVQGFGDRPEPGTGLHSEDTVRDRCYEE